MVHGLHDVELFHELILSQTMSEPLLAEALDGHLVGAVVDVGQHALLDNAKLPLPNGFVNLNALRRYDVLSRDSDFLTLLGQIKGLVI